MRSWPARDGHARGSRLAEDDGQRKTTTTGPQRVRSVPSTARDYLWPTSRYKHRSGRTALIVPSRISSHMTPAARLRCVSASRAYSVKRTN